MIFNNFKFIFFLSVFTIFLEASTFNGVGYGVSKIDSKKEALADLSSQISVDVKSDYETVTSNLSGKYEKNTKNIIHLSSNLPLKGVIFKISKENDYFKTVATIDSKNSLKLYKQELFSLQRNILDDHEMFMMSKNNNIRYHILKRLVKDIERFNKNKIIATLLGAKDLPSIKITMSTVKTQLKRLQEDVSSLVLASSFLIDGIDKKNVYLSSFKPVGSKEVTQFSRVLKNHISSKLDTVRYLSDADYFIKGSYEISMNSIFVTLKLFDKNNELLKVNGVTILSKAYEDLEYKPKTKNFDESINNGFVKSGKLRVSIGFKGYNTDDGIDLISNDTVDIVIKSNKEMCYFLLGHTLKQNNTFTYLLPIGGENTPFINYITGDDVNHAITIATDVPIEAPFGSENLQIFSSTLGKNGKCGLVVPNCEENSDGYCVVGNKPELVVTKTRALAFHKKKKTIEKAEASISFTSFPK